MRPESRKAMVMQLRRLMFLLKRKLQCGAALLAMLLAASSLFAADLPDLIVTSFTAPRSATVMGAIIGISVTVRNQGVGSAGPFEVGFYLSPTPTVTSSSIYMAYCLNASGLSAGSTWTCSGDIQVPSMTPGVYYLLAVADDSGEVAESNELNNVRASDSGTVTISSNDVKPDLIVSTISLNKSSGDPGSTVSVTYTLRNQGASEAGLFANQIVWSDNSSLTSRTVLASRGLSSLAANTTSQQYTNEVTIPSNATPGQTYYIGIVADSGGTVIESNESNNTASTPFLVNGPPAVTITLPTSASTYFTASSPLNLGGTATDAVGVTQVTWTNDRGGSGSAASFTPGTSVNWTISGIALQSGSNVITVTARDAASNSGTDVITVTYDTTAPVVTITTPTSASTYTALVSTLNLGGTATDAVGVTQVTWTNDRGGSGPASFTPGTSVSWTISGIALQSGSNVITVTARDAANNSGTDTLTVTAPLDTTAPVVTITTPTSASTYTALGSTLNLGGTSTDAVGVTQVTWTNDRGGSGSASFTPGTSVNWTISGIALQSGQNVITVTARDAANNSGTDTLTVITPLPTVTFPGMQSSAKSKDQVTAALSLATGYPSSVTGTLELSFAADADNPIDDPTIVFQFTGKKSVGFTIAANTTQAVFDNPTVFSAGTVAGTITLEANKFLTGGVDITPSPAPSYTIQVSRQVPYIEVSSVKITNRTSSSFDVELRGYSNSRELTQATFNFSGTDLQTTSLTVPLTSKANDWYQDARSPLTGSSFKYTQSFTVTQGSATNVTSVSVVLTNKQGNSVAGSGN